MKYVVKKTAMYGSRTYGPYGSYQEALEAKQATSEGKSECCLHLDEWRPVFNRRHTGDNKKSKNTAFTRARSDLVSKGILQVEDDYYGFGDKATFGDKR